MLASSYLQQSDADLQNPLVQLPYRPRLGSPQELKRLVALEILAPVKLLYARHQA